MGKIFEQMLSYLLSWGPKGRQVIKMLVKVEIKRGTFVYKMIEHNMLKHKYIHILISVTKLWLLKNLGPQLCLFINNSYIFYKEQSEFIFLFLYVTTQLFLKFQ